MNLLKNYGTLLLACFFLFSACDKGSVLKDQALSSIPNSVSMVSSVDLPALMKKADFDHVKTLEFYQEVIKRANEYNPVLGDVASDPAKSGIDLSKSFYIANEVNPDNPEEIFVGVVFSLKDAQAFSNLLKTQENVKITKADNFYLLVTRNQSVAWNDNLAVFGSTNSYNDITPMVSKYFNPDATPSIANSKDLQKCLSGNHDIMSWVSSNALAENENVRMMAPMANIDPDALKDNFIHSYLDFKNGEIVGHSSTFLNKGLTKDLKLIFKDEVKTDFSNYVSPEGLSTLITAAIDLKGIKQIIAERPMGMNYINFGLKEFGITADDISNTFGGDMLFTSNASSGEHLGLFATDINDRENLQKFIDLAIEHGLIEKTGDDHYKLTNNRYSSFSPTSYTYRGAQFIVKDDFIFFSNSDEHLNAIKNGGFDKEVDKKLMNKVSGNIFGLFMDYEAIADMMEEDINVDISTLEIAAQRKNSDLILSFKDEKNNSLKQLFEMMNNQYLKEMEKKSTVEKTEI